MPEECQRLALECFVPSYIRTFTTTCLAARFHSSRRAFAIQRRSSLRIVGLGKRAGEAAHSGPPSRRASRGSSKRRWIQPKSSPSIGNHAASPVFVPPTGAVELGPFTARRMRSPGMPSRPSTSLTSSARISPHRHARGDRFERVSVERVLARGRCEARQRNLALLDGSDPRPPHADAPTSEHDRALGASSPDRLPLGVVTARWTAQRDPILLHHRSQNLLARLDAQPEERALRILQSRQQRQRDLDGRPVHNDQVLARGLLRGMLGHGGSFLVGTPSVPHGR